VIGLSILSPLVAYILPQLLMKIGLYLLWNAQYVDWLTLMVFVMPPIVLVWLVLVPVGLANWGIGRRKIAFMCLAPTIGLPVLMLMLVASIVILPIMLIVTLLK
jgi:hypothetical protein